jgi:hypothetical protein
MRVLFVPAALWILFSGCSGSSLVTRFGEQTSVNDLTFDQFTQKRSGKMFEAVLTDSSRIPMRLISARSDSLYYQSLDSDALCAIPTASVSALVYRQDINGLNAAVGGFAGCLVMAAYVGSWYHVLSDDGSSTVQAFLCIIGGTAAGAVIGYNLNTEHEYRFKLRSKKTP